MLAHVVNLESKAVLKPPQSKRYRDCRELSNLAKRLDCGAFTAAFYARKLVAGIASKDVSGEVKAFLPKAEEYK